MRASLGLHTRRGGKRSDFDQRLDEKQKADIIDDGARLMSSGLPALRSSGW